MKIPLVISVHKGYCDRACPFLHELDLFGPFECCLFKTALKGRDTDPVRCDACRRLDEDSDQ